MAISDTITSMYENVGNVYDVLELAGADLTNVDKNIENLKQSWEERLLYFLANGTDVVWNNWLPKVTGSGETITLNNTIEAKMDFVYKGNTSQKTTTGKNLFNVNTTHSNNLGDAGITATFNSDGTITVNGTKNANYKTISYFITLPAGTYYFSGCPSGGSGGGYSIIVQTTNEISSQIFDTGNGATFTLTEQKKISFFPVRVGADAVTFNNTVFKPMIARVPVTYNDYEPYTGNQPSPSPDYPQDIQVVSGDNTIKVEGKNLFDNVFGRGNINNNTVVNRIVASNNLYLKSGNYTISTNLDLTSYKYAVVVTSSPRPTSNDNILFDSNWKTSSYTLNLTTNGYVHILIARTNQFETDELPLSILQGKWFQLEKGTTATTYQPYQSASYSISLGNIELCKIGDYQDKIYKDNGKWYLNKQIGKVVYTGSESGSWTPSTSGGLTRFAGPNISNAQQTVSRLQMKSNYFHYLSSGNEIGGGFIYAGQFFAYPNQTITTEQNFRDWLSTHNTTVYYVLATPTTTEITDTTLISQLEAIKKSYNTQTNISQTNADKPFILDVTALGN